MANSFRMMTCMFVPTCVNVWFFVISVCQIGDIAIVTFGSLRVSLSVVTSIMRMT